MTADPHGSPPLLHRFEPELAGTLPHLSLSGRPTAVRELAELRRISGGRAPIWLKDDGTYGDGGWGGNKVRKLEWILPEAKRRGSKTLMTVGGLGTNWGLAAALYGREQGLKTALALIDQPIDEHVEAQLERLHASGATIHRTHTKARTIALAPALYLRHFDGLRAPYFLPAGGSSPVGALGYVEAGLEIADQISAGDLPEPSHIVTAVGSGGTAAGLAVGLRLAGLDTKVVGIIVNDSLPLDARALTRLGRRTEELLRKRGAPIRVAAEELAIETTERSLGEGYGHPTPESESARRVSAGMERLALDPVYTGKAMSGLLGLNRAGKFGDGPVLFLHTDGPRESAVS